MTETEERKKRKGRRGCRGRWEKKRGKKKNQVSDFQLGGKMGRFPGRAEK